MNTQIKEKVLARLGRLRLQGALAPANFILNLRFKMKKPCFFPLTLCTAVNKDIPSSYFFNSQKC